MNTAIEQYIRELSDLLCCDKTTKQQFLSKFQQTLEDFEAEQENSPISYSDLVSDSILPGQQLMHFFLSLIFLMCSLQCEQPIKRNYFGLHYVS